eukprot:TRINITY_DN8090_c0_g1_i1.p1 TRINITY_DN8090_c0_g1~~TRINITY_DN8090_c0_g1_i1.p1  ORF type:complete len:449 (-),score=43.79 TRINITY_DN8090_c0_g1_i1:34-1380(-)
MVTVLSAPQIDVIRLLACLSGSLSVFGSVSLVISFFLFKELRTHSSKLVMYLSLADLGEAVAWVLSPASGMTYPCYVQGYFEQFFGLSGCLWQLIISTHILQVNMGAQRFRRQELIYHAVGWGIPAITIAAGGSYDIFGNSGAWCWVKSKYPLIGILILYLPALLAIVISGGIYIHVAILLRKGKNKARSANYDASEELVKIHSMKIQLRTRIYIIPFALGWFFGFINRLHNLLRPDRLAILFYLHVIFFPLQGFWNFLMYGLTERIVAPQSMEETITRTDTRPFLSAFLEKQFSKENLDFWVLVERLKIIPVGTEEWKEQSTLIYEQYIPLKAPNEVNINGETKEALAAKYSQGGFDEEDFDPAQKEVMQLIKVNTIGFEQSEQYHGMLESLHVKEAMTGQIQGRLLLLALLQFRLFRTFGKLFQKKKQKPTLAPENTGGIILQVNE